MIPSAVIREVPTMAFNNLLKQRQPQYESNRFVVRPFEFFFLSVVHHAKSDISVK